ncbi:hypothetical protein Cgig2_004215 [Carnegiea gigantea]|uniref:Uncharacterized protein n=1 Tax=Carnegiea gigantea TaxID=171969 RepID=A0A9Q1GTM0_9CARY|nr:hypothetical protein Cgig2_004215 [Carnegiea gigantea]
MPLILGAQPGLSSKSIPQSLEGKSREGDALLSATWKCTQQNGHTTVECRELRKALHELANKGQIDYFLKRGPQFLHKEREPMRLKPQEEYSTEIVATIAGGYTEGITRSARKTQFIAHVGLFRYGRYKLYQLRILSRRPSLLVIFDVLDVRLEVTHLGKNTES